MTAVRSMLAAGLVVVVSTSGCAFSGLNSLPLPGTVGRGSGSSSYHVEIANVGSLESNSPVLIDDVVVGSIANMTLKNNHADVEISMKPDVVIPANAVAKVGQTSLLGSMHLSLDQPLGQPPAGRLQPGATIPLNRSSSYPSTEQTLSSLSVVVNGGGLGQIEDVIHNFNAALSGREGDFRELFSRLNDFVGVLDRQRDHIVATIQSLDRFAATFADQRDVLDRLLRELPPALDVLIRERPRITTALQKLGQFSDVATRLVNDSQEDLVTNLKNLEPTIKSLADVGPDLDRAIAAAAVFPFTQNVIDRAFRGDYANLSVIVDLTIPRLKRTLLLGTRWGDEGAKLVPAPGDPWYLNYTYEPLSAPLAPPPPGTAMPADVPAGPTLADPVAGAPPLDAGPMPPFNEAVLPVKPPMMTPPVTSPSTGAPGPIFAGPYGNWPTDAVPAQPTPPNGGG
ncbi:MULTISPECIES: MCE family protein [unclassified Mycobacterium]|uniref:MCE family protein n=1 Tax=unclassified Mycobacterium TaxID=2642494 RepID=UPI0029C8D9B8|nr:MULTISPECIES: MCE family protein [unclassified Mycobacterium]